MKYSVTIRADVTFHVSTMQLTDDPIKQNPEEPNPRGLMRKPKLPEHSSGIFSFWKKFLVNLNS